MGDDLKRVIEMTPASTKGSDMVDVTAERIVRAMHAQLRNYDYLLPGDFVPEPPLRKRWFRWRPAFAVTQELLVWAGEIARARSLMDLKQAADLIAAADAPPPHRLRLITQSETR